MPYTPNPYNTLQPTDDVFAGTAAAEFRAMKLAMLGIASGATYKGDWTVFVAGVGPHPAVQGDTFTYADALWMLKVDVADVELTPPLVSDTVTWFKQYPTALVIDSLNGAQLAGGRNVIKNGAMLIAQEGVSTAGVVAARYIVDCFQYIPSNAAVVTTSQSADVPGPETAASARVEVTTADATVGVADFAFIRTTIEGRDMRRFVLAPCTLSFKVRSPKTGQHSVALRNSGTDRHFIGTYTIAAADTWEMHSIVLPTGLPNSGTWNFSSGAGITLDWALMAGTNYQTATLDSWVVGNASANAGAPNTLDTIGNVFAVTEVQLEPGVIATPFERKAYDATLFECQRLYERGTAAHVGPSTNAQPFGIPIAFKATKRIAPTVSGANVVSSVGTAAQVAGNTTLDSMTFQVTANVTGGGTLQVQYTADARF